MGDFASLKSPAGSLAQHKIAEFIGFCLCFVDKSLKISTFPALIEVQLTPKLSSQIIEKSTIFPQLFFT